MGIFGDLDVSSVSEDPFTVADGTYDAIVTACKAGLTNAGDKKGLTIEYTIQEHDTEKGKKVTEWKQIPTPVDPDNPTPEDLRSASFLKRRLMDLGVPADRVGEVEPDDLIGTEVVISIKFNPKSGFTNVNRVSVATDSGEFTPGDNPFSH